MYPRLPLTSDEEAQIARFYQEEKMSVSEISSRLGRDYKAVKRALGRLGIPRSPRKVPRWFPDGGEEMLVEMYVVGQMDSYEMAQQFGVCPETIRKHLRASGVQLRPPGIQGAKLRSGERGVHGLSYHPLYQIWNGMIQRCCSPTNKGWDDYGGAGVTVCDRWRKRPEGFANFLEDMGEKPVGTSLDRIDPFGNYEPSNCRWATLDQQANNKRGSKGNLQRMAEEIEMWRERALRAEARLAELSAGSRRRRLRAVQDHLGQPESGTLAVALFEFDADGLPSEVPGSDESAA